MSALRADLAWRFETGRGARVRAVAWTDVAGGLTCAQALELDVAVHAESATDAIRRLAEAVDLKEDAVAAMTAAERVSYRRLRAPLLCWIAYALARHHAGLVRLIR